MPFERISPDQEVFYEHLAEVAGRLLYMSETDAPLRLDRFSAKEAGKRFERSDLVKLFYSRRSKITPEDVRSFSMEQYYSPGAARFFRNSADRIISRMGGGFDLADPGQLQALPDWRLLRELLYDNLIQLRHFRALLEDGVQTDLFVVGRFIQIEVDPATHEVQTELKDWFVLSTYVIQT